MLVLGENVPPQAAQFAASGSAQGGIFALSLAISPAFSGTAGTYSLLPETLHKPIRQKMVVLPARRELGERVLPTCSDWPLALLRRYGFVLPGE